MSKKIQRRSPISITVASTFSKKVQNELIESWKNFLSTQEIIRFIDEKKQLGALKTAFSIEEAIFAVQFPKSFNHLNDFKNELNAANAAAFFTQDGTAILLISNEQLKVTFEEAWKEIILRTTGNNLDFLLSLQVPTENISTGNLHEMQKEILLKIQSWIDLFNKIPGVRAAIYKGDDPDRIIDIFFPENTYAFIKNKKDEFLLIELNANGEFIYKEAGGNMDSLCFTWTQEFIHSESKNWIDVYHWLIKLITKYKNSIPEII